MQSAGNPIASMYQMQLEASRRFADAILSGTRKLDQLVLQAAQKAVHDQLNLAQALASGNERGGTDMAGVLLQRGSNDTVNYQAEFIRVFADMQTELGKTMQEYIDQMGAQAAGAVPRAAPGASQPAAAGNPMTSMFSMWETAFQEATSMTTRNLNAARSSLDRTAADVAAYGRAGAGEARGEGAGGPESSRRGADATEGAGGRRQK